MRHHYYKWPWRYAMAGYRSAGDCSSPRSKGRYESRWHHGSSRSFGVRRPLRYLTWKLDLDENQTRRMAAVLNSLKTEREQAALDEQRTTAELAKLMEGETPTLEEVREALGGRVAATEKLVDETAKAVVAIAGFLDEDQREEFIELLLTGTVSL